MGFADLAQTGVHIKETLNRIAPAIERQNGQWIDILGICRHLNQVYASLIHQLFQCLGIARQQFFLGSRLAQIFYFAWVRIPILHPVESLGHSDGLLRVVVVVVAQPVGSLCLHRVVLRVRR